MMNDGFREELPDLHIHREFPLLNNVTADFRSAGYPANYCPFPQGVSGPRLNMLGSHLPQAMVIKGREHPHIFTGTESDLGELEFNPTKRKNPIEVLEVISRYAGMEFGNAIPGQQIPQITVIYYDRVEKLVSYFNVDRYFHGTDDFGYFYDWKNVKMLYDKTQVIGPDVTLITSPRHDGPAYMMGRNVQTAYMTLPDGIEDAFLLADDEAEAFTTWQISQLVINSKPDMRFLNSQGTLDDYKIVPNIGERVRSDGIACALRPTSAQTYAADVDPQGLMSIRDMQDTLYTIKKNGVVLDLDFHVNRQRAGNHPYEQVTNYCNAMNRYHQAVYDAYRRHCKSSRTVKISNDFNRLVSTAITRLLIAGHTVPGLSNRTRPELEGINGQPVDYIQIVLTYAAERKVQKGFKLTDRFGGKGVVGRICKREHMPKDQNGFSAGLVVCSASPYKRMIIGPLYEQGLNRGSEFVRRRVEDMYRTTGVESAYSYLTGWYSAVNPNYADLVREQRSTLQDKVEHVDISIRDGVDLLVPPFLGTIDLNKMIELQDDYDIKLSPITYSIDDPITGGMQTFTTERDICIGDKYVYLLCKVPKPMSPGIAHTGHAGPPIKPTNRDARHQTPVNEKPVKLGEDENRIAFGSVPVEIVLRLNALHANSPVRGVRPLVRRLMTDPHPTAIERIDVTTEELQRSNAVAATLHHAAGVIGADLRNTLTDEDAPEGLTNAADVLGLDRYIPTDLDEGGSSVSNERSGNLMGDEPVSSSPDDDDDDDDAPPARRGRRKPTDDED